jgi:hypothetical protein
MSSRRDSERGGAEGDESMFGRGQGGLRIEGWRLRRERAGKLIY